MTAATPRYPGRAPIDAYGNGGFRFAEMSHRGSILCLPSGVYAWPPASPDEIGAGSLAPALAVLALYLFGTQVIHGFSFAMLFGIAIGTYSSIFVAASMLLWFGVSRDWSGAETKGAAPAKA